MKRILLSVIVAGLVSSSLSPDALGQTNTGNQGASNGGANQTALATTATPVQGAQFGQLGQTPWFMNSNVRSHLNLSDAQYKQMSDQYAQSYQDYQRSLGNIDRKLTPEARRIQENQLYNNFHRNFDTSLNSVYNDPLTRQRYNELNMQYQGYRAFGDPTVQSRLNLNADQLRRFDEYQNDLNNRYNVLQNQYYSDPTGFNTQYDQLMAQRQNRINNTLTPDQQQIYNTMVGQSYNFTPDYYFNVNSQTGVNGGAAVNGTAGGQ